MTLFSAHDRLRRSVLAACLTFSLIASMAIPASLVATTPAAATTVPGTPGVTQAGTPIYTEDFSNGNLATATNILNYAGSPGTTYTPGPGGTGADGETYTADAGWTPAYNACNGWVLSFQTPAPGTDTGCANNGGASWSDVQDLARGLGLYQGQTPAQAVTNGVLSEHTDKASGAQTAGYQLRSNSDTIPAIPGHYYMLTADFAEANCFSNHASETFYLVVNGVQVNAGSNLDPCTDPSAVFYAPNVHVSHLQSQAIQVPSTGAPKLGFDIYNATTTGTGNDVAFDLPQIVDVTPQLDKVFSPTTINQGQTSTLTLTVTNTSDLAAKNGWSLSDALPAGVVVANPAATTTTCLSPAGTAGTSATVTAAPGSGTVAVNGSLAKGMASCTVTLDVTATGAGQYTNTGCADGAGAPIPGCVSNVTLTGLNPPGTTTLTVNPVVDLSITKTPSIQSYTPGLPLSYTVTVKNAGPSTVVGAAVNDPLPASITSATWTCAPSAGSTCAPTGSGNITDSVTIPAGGQVVYTVTGTVAAGTTGNIVNTATVVPPATLPDPSKPGSTLPTVDANCAPSPGAGCSATATTPGSSIATVKSVSSVTDTNADGITDAGDVIHYSILTTNTGQSTLTNVTLADSLPSVVLTCVPATPATLAPGGQITCTGNYTISAADVAAGTVHNVATATGTPPSGPNVTASSSVDTPTTTPAPQLSLLKSAAITTDANSDGKAGLGDVITFSFLVTNTGVTTLTNVFVNDTLVGPVSCPVSTLAPGASETCTASYTVTSADVEAGNVHNVATATGTPPTGPPTTSPPSSTNTPTQGRAALTLVKVAGTPVDVNGDQLVDAGDTIPYTFVLTNSGTIVLHDVGVTDPKIANVSCPSSTLKPGESETCTGSYTVTKADEVAGKVDNTAIGHGTPPNGPTIPSPPSTTHTPIDTPPVVLTGQVNNPNPSVTTPPAASTPPATSTPPAATPQAPAATPRPSSMAFTGADIGLLLSIALGLFSLGAFALLFSRRKRNDDIANPTPTSGRPS